MSRVISVHHRGVPCAVPASQVVGVVPDGGEDASISLWTGWGSGDESTVSARRVVRVTTPLGVRGLPCETAEFEQLDEERLCPIPDLLVDVLQMPHLVGLTETDGRVLWLVDFNRWEG